MKVNKKYKLVVYNGTSSRTMQGTLIAILSEPELRRFGVAGVELQTQQHPLLPNGTPFNQYLDGEWYVIKPNLTGPINFFVHDSWIKSGGVEETDIRDMVLSGSFKSGRTLDELSAAFVKEGIYDVSMKLTAGGTGGTTKDPKIGVQYQMVLNDQTSGKGNSKLWGVYQGNVSYTLLPSLGLSGEMEYAAYQWPEVHADRLRDYTWMVFNSIDNPNSKFAMAKELLKGDVIEGANQGVYSFTKKGTTDDVSHLRSVLNIAGCTDIIIGTKG